MQLRSQRCNAGQGRQVAEQLTDGVAVEVPRRRTHAVQSAWAENLTLYGHEICEVSVLFLGT
jgi:hypothetical protein